MGTGADVKLGILGRFEVYDDSGGVLALTPQLRRLAALLAVSDGASAAEYDRAEKYLIDADAVATVMASERARSLTLQARSVAAARQGDYETALRLTTEASATGVMPRRNRHDIRLMWNQLRFRVLGGRRVTGVEVRSAWEFIRDESVPDMEWRAAISAAVIVDREGHHDLAERLARWVRLTYPGNVEPVYVAEFAALGLPTVEASAANIRLDDIDTLMAEVLALTDNM